MHGSRCRRLRGHRHVPVITVHVNGKPVELDRPTPLLEYLAGLEVDPRAIAVEHNGEILERPAYERALLRDGDRLEIVRMVGGGVSRPRAAP